MRRDFRRKYIYFLVSFKILFLHVIIFYLTCIGADLLPKTIGINFIAVLNIRNVNEG